MAGLVLSLWTAYTATSSYTEISSATIKAELSRRDDFRNLYYAAKDASWRDMRHWWVGNWIYPGIGYYRPLTSMLYLAEYQAFDQDFEAYNRVSQKLHLINCAILYFLVLSLFRHRPRSRFLLGLISVHFFTAPASPLGIGISRSISWWPSQNDILSLVFGLLSLLILDYHLCATQSRAKKALLVGALVAFIFAIAAKEMGYITLPMAAGLMLHRSRGRINRWVALDFGAFLAIAVFFWVLRKLVVPNPWGAHLFLPRYIPKGLSYWSGPFYTLFAAKVWWAIAVSCSVALIMGIGLHRRWAVWKTVLLAGAVSLLCAQFVGEEGSWAIIFISSSQETLRLALTYLLAVTLFLRYYKTEPGLWAAACYFFVFCPILQFAGHHYFYWPCAIIGLCDAVFCACLWRWVQDLRREADWSLPKFIEARIAAERAAAIKS